MFHWDNQFIFERDMLMDVQVLTVSSKGQISLPVSIRKMHYGVWLLFLKQELN